MGKYIYEDVKDFNLDHIFDCGQCFRWSRREDGSYTGTAMGKAVNMRLKEVPTGGGTGTDETGGACEPGQGRPGECYSRLDLVIDNCSEEDFEKIWRPYLDLDRDYGAIKATLAESDNVMAKAIEGGGGIRILKQELWETMVSFIISQNNNIPRIKGCIENLARLFGEPAGKYNGIEYYNVPSAEVIADLTAEDLASCRLGYRASYLIETARQVMERGGVEAVAADLAAAQTPEEACEYLRGFQGIGPKVASCIALFGLGRLEAFPIDVWVRRVMSRLYGIDEKDTKTMSTYAAEHFGENGGIAQQYLFYYIRGLENQL
ncbi:MAG: DNA-3-methyladenine glycosylase family protein [Anaerovoracaceae bacterium]